MKRFRDLPADVAEQFIRDYYNGGKVKEPLVALGVNENFKRIYEQFPPENLKKTCEYCGETLLRKRLARNNTDENEQKASIYCPKCDHKPNVARCDCKKCREKPERVEEEQRQRIKEYWGKPQEKIDYSKLSFREKVFLGVMLRVSEDTSMNIILPMAESHFNVAPQGSNFLFEIANSLFCSKAIVPSVDADIGAFVLDSKDFPSQHYPVHMKYILNVKTNSDSWLYSLLTNPSYYNSKNISDALELWREIAMFECVEYFVYQLNLFKFSIEGREKVKTVFRNLLNLYSVSQIYSIIWMSVSRTVRGIQRKKLNTNAAANYAISICQEYSNLNDSEKRRIVNFNRVDDLPQSEISSFFFNQVVEIGDKGFYHVPNRDDLETE